MDEEHGSEGEQKDTEMNNMDEDNEHDMQPQEWQDDNRGDVDYSLSRLTLSPTTVVPLVEDAAKRMEVVLVRMKETEVCTLSHNTHTREPMAVAKALDAPYTHNHTSGYASMAE
jgi:hypothetical protein